jgi:hypothetical protein
LGAFIGIFLLYFSFEEFHPPLEAICSITTRQLHEFGPDYPSWQWYLQTEVCIVMMVIFTFVD